MKPRLDYGRVASGIYEAMDALDRYAGTCGLDEHLLHLVRLRASQINGCAYCLDIGRVKVAGGEETVVRGIVSSWSDWALSRSGSLSQ